MIYIQKCQFFADKKSAIALKSELVLALGDKAVVRTTTRKSNGKFPFQVKCTLSDKFQNEETSNTMEFIFSKHTYWL